MKSNLKFTMLILGGIIASFTAADSKAQPVTINSPVGTFSTSTTQPGVTYSFSNSQLSVYSGVQFGNNQNVNVAQNSNRNVSAVAQVGRNLNTTVSQTGLQNYSAIAQVGQNKSALVYQFGR